MYIFYNILRFLEQGELVLVANNESSVNPNIVKINEETFLTALEASQTIMYDIDYTLPITIEIGATDRPQQDNSINLGNFFLN